MKRHRVIGVGVVLCLLANAPAHAQDDNANSERLRAMLQDTTQRLRQQESQNQQLRRQLEQTQQQIAQIQANASAQADRLQSKVSNKNSQVDNLQSSLSASNQRISRAQDLLGQWQSQYQKLQEIARSRDADATAFKKRYNTVKDYVASCYTDNQALVMLNEQVVDAYKNKSIFNELQSADRLTGLGRIDIQKMAHDYHVDIQKHEQQPFDVSQLGVAPVDLPVDQFPEQPSATP